MAETLQKLRPDRDLQCYFERPSGVAALSETSASGFKVSGCWRQQFDWAVIEWNRDNTFEHPTLRNLPDGDLSGLQLSYEETRSNCIPLDSSLYPTVDWPYLRVWAEAAGVEQLYKVRLSDHATAVEGTYGSASAIFELQGTPTANDYIELAWLEEHYTYQLYGSDTLETAAQAIVDSVNAFSSTMTASRAGTQITLQYLAAAGANANRVGVYANVAGAKTESWHPSWQLLSGGTSPTKWRIDLNFGSLTDIAGATVPTGAVRRMRWTYSADLKAGAFVRSEFLVTVSNWTVTGTNRGYLVAGPGSRRIEDHSPDLSYTGSWTESRGNFSGGSIRYATAPGSTVSCTYRASQSHTLYLGTRKAPGCAQISVTVDGTVVRNENLVLAGEDVLMRISLGTFPGSAWHSVQVTHTGAAGSYLYFDFLELAIPATDLPTFPTDVKTTLATDWDTDHSIALAPERTAWLIKSLGFMGRANHYVGALWFYELVRQGHQYAAGTIEFSGTPEFGKRTDVHIGPTTIGHVSLIGDSTASVAKAFELLINQGSTGIWADASGSTLTMHARAMGVEGNAITIAAETNTTSLQATPSGPSLAGGTDGNWRTDLNATPRVNRAARDWCRSFYRAMKDYGIDVTAAFSMELQHGDPSTGAGIAQRYPSGDAVWLNTPALQTNFSPTSLAFWKEVYRDMAQELAAAGLQPYLQFGEVQWWYFPEAGSGMTFYDAYTTSSFAAAFGRPLPIFADGSALPAAYPDECDFLSALIGSFTDAVMSYVRQTYPTARFEVLYPPDVNEAPLNGAVNLPRTHWTPANLDCFKTENFLYTGARDLNKAKACVMLPMELGFPTSKSAHLVGIGDYTTPWEKEHGIGAGAQLESLVLFALDQFCLIGYRLPVDSSSARSLYLG